MACKNMEKRRLSKQKYLRKKKIEKFGIEFADVDMRGWRLKPMLGKEHPKWNDGKMLSSHGYVIRKVSKGHPLSFGNGYIYEHLLVWVEAGNPKPKNGFVLHHIDGNKENNDISNLQLIKSATHMSNHMKKFKKVWQYAVGVLKETGNPCVKWGDKKLLHMIADRADLKTKQCGRRTEANVMAALGKSPGLLIKEKQLIGNHWCNVFRLPKVTGDVNLFPADLRIRQLPQQTNSPD